MVLWSLIAAVLPAVAHAQSGEVFVQARIGADLKTLTEDISDPFFRLVLDGNADTIRLSDIESLIQPNPAQRSTFVVHEEIMNPALDQVRWVVIAFKGTHAPSGIEVENNVGRLATTDTRSELLRLATQLIAEEAMEAEQRDVLGRGYYAHGAEPAQGYRALHPLA